MSFAISRAVASVAALELIEEQTQRAERHRPDRSVAAAGSPGPCTSPADDPRVGPGRATS